MKRVVFLILLGCFFTTNKVEAATTDVYQFTDYDIRATQTIVDGIRGYQLEKVGKDPFSRLLLYQESSFHINEIIEIEGNHVIYGYIHQFDGSTYYDGFITILGPNGDELHHMTYDYQTEEDVRFVHAMDGVIMVAVSSVEKNDRDQYNFLKMTMEVYDYNYQLLSSFELYDEVTAFLSTENMLLLNTNYDSLYDLGITSDLEMIYQETPLPIETNQRFMDTVTIPFLNTAVLNEEEVQHGITINIPGIYALSYGGYTYHFKVVPTITGVEDGGVYTSDVTPIIRSGQVYLDQDLFLSGTTISEPGQYSLVIRGLGGYQETITFTITSNLEGIVHNTVYMEPVELTFNGSGYLNNGYISSPYIVEDPGEYILRIEGENEYRETYFFTINQPRKEYTVLDFLKQFDLAILGITLIAGFIVIKKK